MVKEKFKITFVLQWQYKPFIFIYTYMRVYENSLFPHLIKYYWKARNWQIPLVLPFKSTVAAWNMIEHFIVGRKIFYSLNSSKKHVHSEHHNEIFIRYDNSKSSKSLIFSYFKHGTTNLPRTDIPFTYIFITILNFLL